MTRKITVKNILGWVLLLALVLTLVFIFSNSLKKPEQSLEDSEAVSDILSTIIPPDTEIGAAVHKNIRKTAHFLEFGLLGAEAAVLVWFYFVKRRRLAVSLSPVFGVITALVDETLQYTSDRGPSVLDVWIDVGGYVTFLLLAFGTVILITLLVKKISNHRNKNENTASDEAE